MSDISDDGQVDPRESAYVQEVKRQIMEILNGVKEELGVDTPIEIEVRDTNDE